MPLSLLRQDPNARADAVLSASSERGLNIRPPEADTATNNGALTLRASGVPLASAAYDLALQTGGNVTGYGTFAEGVIGATLRWRSDGGSATSWRGYVDTPYCTLARVLLCATAGTDYPGFSSPRVLSSGGVGFVYTERGTPNKIKFAHKTTRMGAWTHVTIHSATLDGAIIDDQEPALVVTPSGRLLAFYLLDVGSSQATIRVSTSTDDGATWAVWSAAAYEALTSLARRLCAEYVEDSICLVASMKAGGTVTDARVFWSSNGGASFTLTDTTTRGPVSTTVSRQGVVLLLASNQVSDAASVYSTLPGGGVSASIAGGAACDGPNSVHAIGTRDDGILWTLGGGATFYPAPYILAKWSSDGGLTWNDPDEDYTNGIFFNGVDTSTVLVGYRALSVGWWNGTGIVLAGSDGTTASVDDSIHELNFGGWDYITEQRSAGKTADPYADSCFVATDHPHNLGWARTDTAAGATLAFTADGYQIVGTAANNTYWICPTFFQATATTTGRRIRAVVRVDSGGSVADDRSIIRYEINDGGGNCISLKLRLSSTQMVLIDGAGTTLGTGSELVAGLDELTEILIAINTDTSATTGTVSAWYRLASQTLWTNFVNAQVATETAAAATRCTIGGLVAGAVDWTIAWIGVADDYGEILPGGFTNPDDLAGRPLDAATDFQVTNGIRIGGAGGGGVAGDTYTLTTGGNYHREWIWRSMEPWQVWRSTGDNAATNLVLYSSGDVWMVNTVAMFGTNFRTCTYQMHTSDSWGSPAFSVGLDATLASSTVTGGPGYLKASNGLPWRSGQWRSATGRRFFVEVGGVSYEITDNTRDSLLVRGVDLSAATGTAYIYGDRMAVRLSGYQTYAYARILIGAQQTADNYYQIGTVIHGQRLDSGTPYASGFVEEVGDVAVLTRTDEGRAIGYQRGPAPERFRLAFDPVSRPDESVLAELEDLYRAIPGSRYPVVLWPDAADPQGFGLFRVFGPYARENITGQGATALERLSQLVFERVA